jgi:hypothetical protein
VVALDPSSRLVYVLPVDVSKKPSCTRAHQGTIESVHQGVQYMYLAAHVCPRPPKKKAPRANSNKAGG